MIVSCMLNEMIEPIQLIHVSIRDYLFMFISVLIFRHFFLFVKAVKLTYTYFLTMLASKMILVPLSI